MVWPRCHGRPLVVSRRELQARLDAAPDTGAAIDAEAQAPIPPGQTDPSSEAGWPQLAAGTSLFVGLLITVMGLAHLYGVMVTAIGRSYAYDFRLAALLLVGMTLVFGSALCLSAVRGSPAVDGLPGAAR